MAVQIVGQTSALVGIGNRALSLGRGKIGNRYDQPREQKAFR